MIEQIYGIMNSMTVHQLIHTNRALIKAFEKYQKRYLNVGKKPDISKLLPEDIYSTMRLEGEPITRKQAQALFQ